MLCRLCLAIPCVTWLVACGAPSAPPVVVLAPEAPAEPPLPVVQVPAGPVGRALIWAIDLVDPTQPLPTEAELGARMAPEFAGRVGASALLALVTDLRAQLGGVVLTGIEAMDDDEIIATTRAADGRSWRIALTSRAAAPFEVSALLFRPAIDLDLPRPTNWDELYALLGAVSPEATFLAARVFSDRCVPRAELAATDQRPVSGTASIWTLAATVDAIVAGTTSWEAELASSDRTLFEAAEQAFANADLAAADELLEHVGRAAVEQAMVDWFHSAPHLNLPFLRFEELFVLKGVRAGELSAGWAAATEAARRERLAAITPDDVGAVREWTQPFAVEEVGWFASQLDLCRVMAAMHDRAETDDNAAVIRHLLSQNPGIMFDQNVWSYAAYRGGSEPGVLQLTWLLEDTSGGRWFVGVNFTDPSAAIDANLAVTAASWAVDLLAASR